MNKSMKGKNNRMTPNTKDDRWNERARSWQCGVVLVGGEFTARGKQTLSIVSFVGSHMCGVV